MRTVHVTQDYPANALDLSPDNTQVVIAGRQVFKIFSLDENGLGEKANLRPGKHLNLNFSCNDVVWNPVEDSLLATASTNGAVVTWNLNKASRSKLDCVFNDHTRTVHKVSFHPGEGHLLISGSHDGYMKLFDLRRREASMTFTSNAESVRDVKFNPHHPITFCAVSENGNVQVWDMRRPDRVEKQYTAHGGPIFALDWHPDIRHWLATAGRDKTIKVWDLHENPTTVNTIQTIASVGRIKWRPNTKYHIASSALLWDCSINVWDTRRPYIPLAAFHEHRNLTTAIAWAGDPNTLISVGKDCSLIQHWFPDAVRPMEEVNPLALAIGTLGHVAAARPPPHATLTLSPAQPSTQPQPSISTPRTILNPKRCGSSISSGGGESGAFSGTVISKVEVAASEPSGAVSTQHLIICAKQYLLTGRSLAEICEHNAAVASGLSRHQVALTWQMLHLLYGGGGGSELLPPAPTSHPAPPTTRDDSTTTPDTTQDADQRSARHLSGGDAGGGGGGDTSGGLSAEEGDTETDDTDTHELKLTNIASGMTVTQDFFFGDGEVSQVSFDYDPLPALDPNLDPALDSARDWTLPTEAFEPRQDILHRSPAPPRQYPTPDDLQDTEGELSYVVSGARVLGEMAGVETGVGGVGEAEWKCGPLVAETLKHYASLGDVQMAVTCFIVLGHTIKGLLEEAEVEHWFLSYINLLHHFRLWNVANQVIQLAACLPSVMQQNQQSTTVTIQCGRCNYTLSRNSVMCRKCGGVAATCSVCHGVVRGLYVWCQGCLHGGHLHHLRDWMATNRACPAGCGHLCEYT
ncbi:hypothetical protein Pmani_026936 [Petrolisthes manimaculis]|uniref:GATOR2 complex protein WDR24 n=1 Tax=Petrolisthes manimaculis TaxID=1843537 RepID=A0AAE1TXB7_9EUCA|nr:hypothetical protein Pmani_026936 [Petrolisthes manimaculis]